MSRIVRLLAPLLVLVVLSSGIVVGDEPLDPKERARLVDAAREKLALEERAFAKRVNEAIDKGDAWLQKQQQKDGTFPIFRKPNHPQNLGRQALVIYTLAKCGAAPKDKVIKSALGGLGLWFGKIENPGWGLKTYSAAVTILMYDALYNPPPKKRSEADERYAAPKHKKCKYPKKVQKEIQRLLDWLVEHQEAHVWRYPGGAGGSEDLSHTQLVLLAFQAAGRCGLEVDPEVYKKALHYVFEKQEKDGPEEILWHENPAYEPGIEDRYGPFLPGPKTKARGWGYMPGDPATGSMTGAGLASLAIIKERLAALEALEKTTSAQIDRSLLGGLAWLSARFTVDENPGQGGGWHYYYLYGLERVGSLLGWKHIGKHDWYREGAELLIRQQEETGRWPSTAEGATEDHEDEILQTCFALLFLKRATVPPAQPVGPVVTGG